MSFPGYAGESLRGTIDALQPRDAFLLVGSPQEWGFFLAGIPDYGLVCWSWEEFLGETCREDLSFGQVSAILITLGLAKVPPSVLFDRAGQFLRQTGILMISMGCESRDDGCGSQWRRRRLYLQSLAAHHGFHVAQSMVPSESPHDILVFHKTGAARWRLIPAVAADVEGCIALFRKVFNTEMSQEFWVWKYGDGRGRAMIACCGDEVVAHYGATTRRISFMGRDAQALQICDVMVDPKQRGVMTRKGAFFQVASAFLETHFGYYNEHLLAYGFPNLRHMRLAEKVGLYAEVARMIEIRWAPLPSRPRLATSTRVLIGGREDSHVLGKLWAQMKEDLSDAIVVVRDPDYLQYRYFEHPQHRYEVMAVMDRLTGYPRGVVVMRREREGCKLLDIVARRKDIPLLIDYARRQTSHWGLAGLSTWISSPYADVFANTGDHQTMTEVCIPTNIWTDGPSVEQLKDRWWLMMGDTDFL
jgi:hypothetical protein